MRWPVQQRQVHLLSSLQVRHSTKTRIRKTAHADWTGIRVEISARDQHKPSLELDITVDDVVEFVSFQSRASSSPWTWEVASGTAMYAYQVCLPQYFALRMYHRSITRRSEILIQPYRTGWFNTRRKRKSITIPGDVVFRLCSAATRPGDGHGTCTFIDY
jgi:hypothetical protein